MRTKALVSLLLTFVVSIPVLTQQPQLQKPKPTAPVRQQPETEEDQDSVVLISTNLVQLDAVVTKDGKVVTDLTPADFVITEDGKPQSITHFSYVSNSPAEDSVAKPEPSTNASVILPAIVKRDETRRTIAIVAGPKSDGPAFRQFAFGSSER